MSFDTMNRRKDQRVERPVVLRFRKLDATNESKWDMTLVRNISKSGAFFNSTMKLNVGERLMMKLHNPTTDQIDNCVGEVVRSADGEEHGLFYETAIKFTELVDDSLKSFYSFMDSSLALT